MHVWEFEDRSSIASFSMYITSSFSCIGVLRIVEVELSYFIVGHKRAYGFKRMPFKAGILSILERVLTIGIQSLWVPLCILYSV